MSSPSSGNFDGREFASNLSNNSPFSLFPAWTDVATGATARWTHCSVVTGFFWKRLAPTLGQELPRHSLAAHHLMFFALVGVGAPKVACLRRVSRTKSYVSVALARGRAVRQRQ